MSIVKKRIIVHSKKSNNHENKNETMKLLFNVSQLFSVPQFFRANF